MNLRKFYTGKAVGFVVVLVLVAVFYGGVVYGKRQTSTRGIQTFNQNTIGAMRGTRNIGTQGGFVTGEIISKDAKSITVKLANGGSKIVFVGTNTIITKNTAGSVEDLAIGTNISVGGNSNSDGSTTAESIQIRPNMPQGAKVY